MAKWLAFRRRGLHFHGDLRCSMVGTGYEVIGDADVRRSSLHPCTCVLTKLPHDKQDEIGRMPISKAGISRVQAICIESFNAMEVANA